MGYRPDQKTGRRDFPLPPHVARLLAARPSQGDGYLLDLPVSHLAEAFRSRLWRACEKEGFTGDDRFTPHGLRRMVVQDMAYAVLKARLGVLEVPLEKGQVLSGPWSAGGRDDEA